VFQTSRPSALRRAASSGGHASPPKISSRTFSIASPGHMAASVGTVETTVMPWRSSHGARSSPERTSERGAGTRQAPCRHASHISSHEASKATDRPASTRSSGPSGASCRNSRASASTNAAAERWVTATPFGTPVDPDVKMIQASSSTSGGGTATIACVAGCGASPSNSAAARASPVASATASASAPRGPDAGTYSPAPVMIPRTAASPNTSRARSSGSSASTGTYAAPAARIPRIEMYSSFEPDGIRTPTRSPRRTPASWSRTAVAPTRAMSSR